MKRHWNSAVSYLLFCTYPQGYLPKLWRN